MKVIFFELHTTTCTAYIDRLKMPKLIVSASGDEFFQIDDSYYFWDALKGDNFLR